MKFIELTINEFDNGLIILTKGSFDSIIKCCTKIYINGNLIELTNDKKKELKKKEKELSNKAYRVLSYAYNNIENFDDKNIEKELIFLGIILRELIACDRLN